MPQLLLQARWIVPVFPSCEPLEGYALVVDGGEIKALEPLADARYAYPQAHTVELPHHLLIPGLVNAHTHAAMSLLRGIGSDAVLQRWLEDYIWPLEQRWVDADFVRDGTRLAIAEMLLSGTSCFADMYFFPEAAATAAAQSGMRAQISGPLISLPNQWSRDFGEGLRLSREFAQTWRDHALVTAALAPHSVYTVDPEQLATTAETAAELGLRVHIHAHETEAELAHSVERYGKRPLQLILDAGLGPGLQIAHLVHLNAAERALLAQHQIQALHCPSSNLKLASGVCFLDALLGAEVGVGVGTDGAASNDSLDMLSELRLAALLARNFSAGDALLSADRALQLGTLGGARALGLDAQIGSLEPGKRADIVAVNFDHPRTQPTYDPVAQLVYAASSSQVDRVWVDGVERVRDGKLLDMDMAELASIARHWGEKLAPSAQVTR